MKNISFSTLVITLMMLVTLTGCDLVGDIFEAGFWTAIIVIVLIVALVIWLIRKMLSWAHHDQYDGLLIGVKKEAEKQKGLKRLPEKSSGFFVVVKIKLFQELKQQMPYSI